MIVAYALGSAIVLYGLMLGGRKLAAPLARRSGAFQMAIGAVMVLVAFAMWQGYDNKFQSNVVAEPAVLPAQPGGRDRKEPAPPRTRSPKSAAATAEGGTRPGSRTKPNPAARRRKGTRR